VFGTELEAGKAPRQSLIRYLVSGENDGAAGRGLLEVACQLRAEKHVVRVHGLGAENRDRAISGERFLECGDGTPGAPRVDATAPMNIDTGIWRNRRSDKFTVGDPTHVEPGELRKLIRSQPDQLVTEVAARLDEEEGCGAVRLKQSEEVR
jgi:hypothetical protein